MAKIILNVELNSDKVPSGIKKIRNEIASLGQEFGKIKNAKDVTDGVKALTEHYEKLAKAASKVVDAEKKQALADEKVRTQRAKTTAVVKEANDKHAQSLEKLNALQAKTTQEEVKAEQQKTKLTAQTIKLLETEKKLNKELEAEADDIKEVADETVNWSERLKEAQAQIDKVFGNAAIRVWRMWFSEVKKILDDVNETLTKTESTVIELQRVLNDEVSDRQISNALYGLAQQYGQTFENASTIAQNFAKSGMSWNDTIKATESALLAMNVAELNASESSEGLLSIMVQFKKDASELETVVDQLNKTADKNPVTTEKLLKALQRTGSAAVTSNLTLEKTIGIITTLSAATNRSGQNIGTATNALIMYTQKNLDTFAAMSEESAKVVENFKRGTADVVDIWRQAQDEISKLKNNKDQYNSLLDLFGGSEGMEELNSSLHDELEDTFEQINSVYSIANTYRKNYFIALLDNLDRLDNVLEGLEDTQGYSQEENLKYMSTYEAKLNTLEAKWQYIANDEQGLLKFKKDLVDLGIKALDLIKNMGGIVNVLMTITGIIGGLVITIKSATIAKKVGEAAAAFRAMRDAVQGVAAAGESAQASFGWIGVAIVALTAVIGVVNGIRTSIENARQAAIDAADVTRDNGTKVAELTTELSGLDTKSDEYYEVEQKIVELLGDKKDLLSDLAEGTNSYTAAVQNLTKHELEEELARQKLALEKLGSPGGLGFFDSFGESQRKNFYNEAQIYFYGKGQSYDQTDEQTLEFYEVIKQRAADAASAMTEYSRQMRDITDTSSKAYQEAQRQEKEQLHWYEYWNGIISDVAEEFEEYERITEAIAVLENALYGLTGKIQRTQAEYELRNLPSGETSPNVLSAEELKALHGKKTNNEVAVDTGASDTTDYYLESLKAAVSLRKSELTLMQHQGASLDEQVAKNKEIQEALHIQAEYLRQKGADQAEINALSSEWYTIQENITKLVKSQYTDEINLIKSRLTLMEHQEVSADKQIEQMKEIQSNLHEEAEYLRQIKASEEEINAVSSEWWTWQEKILKLYQETLEKAKELELDAIEKVISSIQEEIDLEEERLSIAEKQLAVTNAQADLEKAIAQAKIEYVSQVLSDYITALSDAQTLEEKQKAVSDAREKYATAQKEAQTKAIVEAMKAQKDLGSDALSLEEKRLAVEEARQALIDAENDRTTRVFDEASGEWHYEANAQNVKSAQEKLADAVKSLDDYLEGEAWNEIISQMEEGSLSESEMLSIIDKWEKQGYGSSEWGAKIKEAYRLAIGTKADPSSVAGELNSVNSAVKSLNDYLKNQAIKELQTYIKDGNTSTLEMQQIMDKWLSKGEGGEIWSWSAGVINEVNKAIKSGWYDDNKVQSNIKAVETAVKGLQDYLDKQMLSEIKKLMAGGGTAADIGNVIDKWSALGASEGATNRGKQYQSAQAAIDDVNEFYDKIKDDPSNATLVQGIIDNGGRSTVITTATMNGSTMPALTEALENGIKFDMSAAKEAFGFSTGATNTTPSESFINTRNVSDSHNTTNYVGNVQLNSVQASTPFEMLMNDISLFTKAN